MLCLGATSVLCAGYATDQACWLQFPVALTSYIVLTHPPCCDSWTLMNCGIIVSPKDHCVLCMWGIIMSLRIIVSYVWGIIVSLRIIVSYVWGNILLLRIIVSYVCEGYLTAVSTGVCGMHCYCYCCEFTVLLLWVLFVLSQRISCHMLPPFIAESADICWLYLLWLPNWKVLTKVQSWHAHPVSCGKWHWGWKELAMTRLEPATYKTNVWCSSNWATTCLYEGSEYHIVMFVSAHCI